MARKMWIVTEQGGTRTMVVSSTSERGARARFREQNGGTPGLVMPYGSALQRYAQNRYGSEAPRVLASARQNRPEALAALERELGGAPGRRTLAGSLEA